MCLSSGTLVIVKDLSVIRGRKNNKNVLHFKTSPSLMHDANARGRDVFNYFAQAYKSPIAGEPSVLNLLSMGDIYPPPPPMQDFAILDRKSVSRGIKVVYKLKFGKV